MHLTKAFIDTNILINNYLNIKKKVGNTMIMAVVKADAYGHNVKIVVETLNSLNKNKPDFYAVATPDEGAELRRYGIKQSILIFEPVYKDQVKKYFEFNLIPTVFTKQHLELLLKEKQKLQFKQKIIVHIKVDTGMNRLGIEYDQAFDFIQSLSSDENFKIGGVYTHFATADVANNSYTKLQIKRFKNLLTKLEKNNINRGVVHASNTGAILNFPEANFDMVRTGLALFGYYPSLQCKKTIKLQPVMSLVSVVSTIKNIDKDETISYGRRYKTSKPTKIISVPLGYADGFPRSLTNKAQAIIKGKLYKQVGAVTMDRIMFDVKYDDIKVGDKVILLGKNGKYKIDAWDWAKKMNAIPYEVICGISKRVPRIVKQ